MLLINHQLLRLLQWTICSTSTILLHLSNKKSSNQHRLSIMNQQALLPHILNRNQKLITEANKDTMITIKIKTKITTITTRTMGITTGKKTKTIIKVITTTIMIKINTTMEENRTTFKIITQLNLKEWTVSWKHTSNLRK